MTLQNYVVPYARSQLFRGISRANDAPRADMKLSDFEKVEKIGEGTFGKVYRAILQTPEGDSRPEQIFALKKLNMVFDES